MDTTPGSVILFTAFEPSGDAHAAPVIAGIKERAPDLRIFAWGGPKMEAAGAELMGHTCDDGAMGLGGFAAALKVYKTIREIRRWSKGVPLLAHVPVDSPAANFPICRTMRSRGVRVIHMVAPQLWAWGPWRIRKLRRLTDMVLCLLPFEEQWFRDRGVPAKFIGHPVLNRELDEATLDEEITSFPQGSPRILLLPGSRSGEIKANLPLICRSFSQLRNQSGRAVGIIVAANENSAREIRSRLNPMPQGIHLTTGNLDAAIRWADLAITVSGTVSLDMTRHETPMVGVYSVGPISWLGSKVLLQTPSRLLPNIIAEERVVPEFVPYLGWRGAGPIVKTVAAQLSDSRILAQTAAGLAAVREQFTGHDPDREASEAILSVIGRGEESSPLKDEGRVEGDSNRESTETGLEETPPRKAMHGFSPGAQDLGNPPAEDS